MRTLMRACLVILVSALAVPAIAQSPNTATLVVVVVDQTGAVVNDAKVSVVNSATGATREAVSGADGSATIAALLADGHLHGQRREAGLHGRRRHRTSRCARVKRRRSRSSWSRAAARPRSTVYGTTQGVRADAQIGRRLDGSTDRRDADPRPQGDHAAAAQLGVPAGKGTGDLFVNATYFVTGAGGRRTTTFTLDGANNDEGWGRQTMLATVPIGAIQEIVGALERVLGRVRLDRGAGAEHRDQVGHQRVARRRAVHGPPGRRAGEDVLDQGLLRTVGRELRRRRRRLPRSIPRTCRTRWTQFSGIRRRAARQGQDVLLRHRRLHAAGSHDVPVADAAGVRAAGGRQPRLRGQLPPDALQRARSITSSRRARR